MCDLRMGVFCVRHSSFVRSRVIGYVQAASMSSAAFFCVCLGDESRTFSAQLHLPLSRASMSAMLSPVDSVDKVEFFLSEVSGEDTLDPVASTSWRLQ